MLNLKKGRLLISEPSLDDPTFFKSIILLTYHSNDESIGLILNKPTKIKLNEILNDIPLNNLPLYIGGPVEQNTVQYIHTLGEQIADSREISEGLFWGGDFDDVKLLMKKKALSRNKIRFFAGYSGWHRGQLEDEIKENSWIIEKSNIKTCMKYSTPDLWSSLVRKQDEKYAIWSNMPKDPSLN